MDGSFDLKSMQRSNNFVCVCVSVCFLSYHGMWGQSDGAAGQDSKEDAQADSDIHDCKQK